MDVCILGAGGIGGFLGAKLIGAGHRVSVLARGAHLASIRESGIRLVENGAETVARPAAASDALGDLPPADLIIIAVKGQDLPEVIDLAARHAKKTALMLPFQNGVDAPDLLVNAFGGDRALIGVARIFSNITAPGVVTRYGGAGSFTVGDSQGRQSTPAVRGVIDMFRAADVVAPDCADVRVDLWQKFVMFNAVSGVTAAARCRIGDIRRTPELMQLFEGLMVEVAAIAKARGIPLPQDVVTQTLDFVSRLPDEARSSTAHDLEAGKPIEVDRICGAVARMGRDLGVATPLSSTVAAILVPWKQGRPL